ncbi:hypothetical protein A2U01_0074617, partial [Trifolium medium]|nr:hypothetical protein [Trifolium medium]
VLKLNVDDPRLQAHDPTR